MSRRGKAAIAVFLVMAGAVVMVSGFITSDFDVIAVGACVIIGGWVIAASADIP